jgi:hypothetical protein
MAKSRGFRVINNSFFNNQFSASHRQSGKFARHLAPWFAQTPSIPSTKQKVIMALHHPLIRAGAD